MGKKSRLKRERRLNKTIFPCFVDEENLSVTYQIPGAPIPGFAEEATVLFQKNLRNSPMWKLMVDKYGEQKAEELLKQCKAEIR